MLKDYAKTADENIIAPEQALRKVSVNQTFHEVFKVKPEETVEQLMYDLTLSGGYIFHEKQF